MKKVTYECIKCKNKVIFNMSEVYITDYRNLICMTCYGIIEHKLILME